MLEPDATGRPPENAFVTITLREIAEDNAPVVLALRLAPGQERFVDSVAESRAEADRHPEGNPWFRAAYDDDLPVGFVMLSWAVEPQPPDIHGPWFLWKLLVDHPHQGKGYGRDILGQVVELIRSQGATELRTSYVPGEGGPAGFYARLDLVRTAERDSHGEVILRRHLRG